MTDLAHMTQMLQETAHREHYRLPALRDWLRDQREERSGATERNRRLDSDAAAVQIMTVWVSKGLQFPIVYLPFAFNRRAPDRDMVLFHDDGVRCLHIGGKDSPDFKAVEKLGRKEDASDDSRLTYVAMTRAQSQVVAWWSPAWDEPNGGLSRLLRGRRPGESVVPDRCEPAKISDDDAMARLREWEAAGGPVIEDSVVVPVAPVPVEHAAVGSRRSALPPRNRHGVAAHVVFGLDPRRGDDRGEQRAGGHRTGRRGRRHPARSFGCWRRHPVPDGRSADGREVRHAGARGAGDGRPVRRGPRCRVGVADPRALGVVAGRRARCRTGRRDGADARHPVGSAGRRTDAAADRAAGSVAGVGLRVPAGRWRSARGRAEYPARRRRPSAAASTCPPTTRWHRTPTG